jgi:alpha-tubulin suppressor-like RCC1 family protein
MEFANLSLTSTIVVKSLLTSSLALLLLLSIAIPIRAATKVTQAAAGFGASLFLKSDGSVWATDSLHRRDLIVSNGVVAIIGSEPPIVYLSSDGSLWVGSSSFYITSGQIASNVTAIAQGFRNGHILFTKSDGSLWGAGDNRRGQLGDGASNNIVNYPIQITSDAVVSSAAGGDYSLFIKSDGSLWGMGRNDYGQLGDGTTNDVSTSEEIVPSGVVAASAGFLHSLFIKSDGSLWGMGDNEFGQLGDGTYNSTNRPKQILSSGVTAISCGQYHSLFIKSDGSLWAMGYDFWGQLGDSGRAASGPNPCTNLAERIVSSDVVAVSAGLNHSLFIKSDDTLWGMGYGNSLGTGFPYYPDYISYSPDQLFPLPQPSLTTRVLSKTNLEFTATSQLGGKFCLLACTNLAQPLIQWAPVATNTVTVRGANNFTVTLTNAVNIGISQEFYILQSQ